MVRKYLTLLILAELGAFVVGALPAGAAEDGADFTPDVRMASDAVGCKDLSATLRLFELLAVDVPAALAFLTPREKLGVCANIAPATHVFVEKRASAPPENQGTLGDFYCVRPQGNPDCFWSPGSLVFGK
jgi:hypothetical protein